jgi:predicted transcriptional regulator
MPSTLEKPRVATVTLKLDTAQRDRLKLLAVDKKRTAHYLMKEVIERYLKVEEAQQAALKSVDEAVAHFEASGLHMSLDEFKTWVGNVKLDRNAQLPACHA